MGLLVDTLQLCGGGVISLVGGGGKTTLMFGLARELAAAGESILTTTTTKIFRPMAEESRQVVVAEDFSTLQAKLQDLAAREPHVTAAGGELAVQGKLLGLQPSEIDALQASGLFRWIVVEADGARHCPLKAPAEHEPVIPACSRWVIAVVGLDALGKPLDDEYVFRSQEYSRLTGVPAGAPVTEESVARALSAPRGILQGAPAESRRLVFINKTESRQHLLAGRKIARVLQEGVNGTIHRVVLGSLLPEVRVQAAIDLLCEPDLMQNHSTRRGEG